MTRPASTRRPAALSIMEVMISLSICSMLLVAVASAFNASAKAVDVNDRFYRATQSARVSMAQILTQIRRAGTCDVNGTWNAAGDTVTGTGLSVSTPTINGQLPVFRTWQFDPAARKLKFYNASSATGTAYSLASNVSAVSFTGDMEPDPQSTNGTKRTVRVTVDITVQVGPDTVRLTGSAVPRAVLAYK